MTQSEIRMLLGLGYWNVCCRKLGVLTYLVHILASGEETGLVAAAVWALLQLAAEDPANQKVGVS